MTGETDLDILLNKRDELHFKKIVAKYGFIKLNSQFGSRYYDIEDWVGMDNDTGALIHIHLHYRLATGHTGMKEFSLPWTDGVLNNKIKDKNLNVYICPPNYELVCLFTRIALKAKVKDIIRSSFGIYRISNNDHREIIYLINRVNNDEVKKICNISFNMGNKVFEIISNTDLDGFKLNELRRAILKDMCQCRIINGYKYIFSRMFYYPVVTLRGFLRRRLNMCIITMKTI